MAKQKLKCLGLTKPCNNCPFLRIPATKGWLAPGRVEEIAHSITRLGQSFPCHKTTVFDDVDDVDDDGDVRNAWGDNTVHCAGALVLLNKLGQPNQVMQVATRLGLWDSSEVPDDPRVFNSVEEMAAWHRGEE